jgi:hypothetical protein
VCRGQAGDDRIGVAQQERAGRGELDLRLTSGSLDEPLADDGLERGDLLTDRGLGVAELLRCAPEGAELGDGVEREQVAELESAPNSRWANELHHKHSLDG